LRERIQPEGMIYGWFDAAFLCFFFNFELEYDDYLLLYIFYNDAVRATGFYDERLDACDVMRGRDS
jgi:hypothetical protein